jgi:hypothetical protein
MKKFFAKAIKGSAQASTDPATAPTPAGTPPSSAPPSSLAVHRHSLAPKFTVPAVPHPSPHTHLALLATDSGLLLRPHAPGLVSSAHVRVPWGAGAAPEDVRDPAADEDWENAVVVYGIIGMMELFDGARARFVQGR